MSFEWFSPSEPVVPRKIDQSTGREITQINELQNNVEHRQSPENRIVGQIDNKTERVENLAISATNERFATIHTTELANRTQELASLPKEFNIGMQITYPGINLEQHWWHQQAQHRP